MQEQGSNLLNGPNEIKNLLDHFHEGILIVDKDGIIQFLNREYSDFLGVDRDEVVGKPVQEIIPSTRLYNVLFTGQPEINMRHKYNDGREVIAHRIPIKMEGKLVGVLAQVVFKDISDLEEMAIKVGILEAKVKYTERELDHYIRSSRYTFDDIVGEEDCLIEAKNLALKGAQSSSMFLLEGESGTGKELFAHAIHHASPRKHGPFIRLNCAAIPSELLEAELFGYERGAFTGAEAKGKPGKFELAHTGTIYLDEIEEMPVSMQSKLLRVLDDREITRLGGTKVKNLDFACIASTNRKLEQMIKEKQFRLDLFYRLNIIHIFTPPLREMKKSIPLLCDYFLKKKVKETGHKIPLISPEVADFFYEYDWPGNIRELNNILESAMNTGDGEVIRISDLPKRVISLSSKIPIGKINSTANLYNAVNSLEKEKINETLAFTNYNISKAARQLGIHRTWLYQKIRKHNLSLPKGRDRS